MGMEWKKVSYFSVPLLYAMEEMLSYLVLPTFQCQILCHLFNIFDVMKRSRKSLYWDVSKMRVTLFLPSKAEKRIG